jgi:diacylglycerol kinase (ATP)
VEIRTKAALTEAIRAHGRTALVVNVRSRRGRRHFAEVRQRLQAAGLELIDVMPVSDPADLPHSLISAATCGADLVVVGGGDGTLSEASHQLAHRDVCLGVVPLGTTNNFARSLGLPLNLSDALQTLTQGKVADVDLGHVAGRHFANLTSIGVSVLVAEHVPHGLKRVLGRAAYPLTALALLPRHQPFRARLSVNGQLHELTTHQLNIANGSFHAGRAIAADAGVDDRLLVIYRLGDAKRLHLTATTVRQAVLGPYRPLARTQFLTADRLWLETDPPLDLDIDGEIRGRTPVQIRLEANALRVMVSPSFEDT